MQTPWFRPVQVWLPALLMSVAVLSARAQHPTPTPAEPRLRGFDQRRALIEGSLVRNLELHNIGPTVMSGRVVDLDVNPADPTTFYVAYASGGLWKTTTNGIAFTPLFDAEAVMTLGDIAVDWRHGETIWAGTGENNSSRSSYAGTGVYRSTDGGATWVHRGLAETQRIGRIVLHPDDPNTLWVAALGPLYTTSPHRGVYKTTDGGATWTQTLFVDDTTGVVDLVLDPTNPDVLYAAAWHRLRRPWDFIESGGGSGIYKSTDGGNTWTRLTTPGSGFPTGAGVGRIGLAVFPGNPALLYALLDNQDRRPPEEEEAQEGLVREDFLGMTRDALLALDAALLEAYLRDNRFPAKYSAQRVREMVERGEIQPAALAEYLDDANAQLFDTPVIGAEVYRSDDGGQTWRRTHEDYIDNLYYSYGYYFGEIRVDARNPDKLYLLGVPILTSDDGGRSFRSINGDNVHVDHHALWVNPARSGHLVLGNDGGVNISYDDGATWFKANTPSVGQFYAVQVDDAEPYRVYGGLQDNGVWVGPHTYRASYAWYEEGDYPYDRLLGGDGMQVEVDTRTNDVVYTGFQFGNYVRIDRAAGTRTRIQPRHDLGERPLRFNWQTPIHLSRHNQDILYLGANRLFRSLNRGDDWTAISGDLTQGGREGDVPFGTLTTIDESPLAFGVLYTGSDDGLVHVTRDGGVTWARISDALPPDLWVSRVEASHHDTARVYVTLNGYRDDHFEAYVYRSDDYGQTWTRLGLDLPPEPVNVIVEDPTDERLLYVGTDHGLYVSIDGGARFMAMMGGMPHVPVHDLKIQARAKDLIVGTHGRSIYVADLEHVQALLDLLDQPLHAFDLDPVTYRERWGTRAAAWMEYVVPEISLPYFAGVAGTVTIHVDAADGTRLRSWTDAAERGLNYATYDLSVAADRAEAYNRDRPEEARLSAADNGVVYLKPGTYTVVFEQAGATARTTLTVEAPPERTGAEGPEPGTEPGEEEDGK
ncbi:glycosyl hydrolase [Rhodothermaceae bacterium RA]|nr:glycosyl hydrolase [Rhodothermaceae bacterium RA]